jgi:hypothetical protein
MNRINDITNKKYIYVIFILILVVWALLQWRLAVPKKIVNDWLGWRQADTQTIARNFLKPGSDILHPQINWGGTGPGYLESEFQLYTYLVAQVMKVFGISEWPGQLLSLMYILLTTIVIYALLNLYFRNRFVAAFGAVVFLTSNGAVHLSTAIMPDSLCILFYSLGLFTFLKFLSDQKTGTLIFVVLFSTLAALIKPLALNLGIIQFTMIYLCHRHLLKSPKIWAAWLTIVAVVAAYMAYSYHLYLTYGNTFGVLGGDSKFPTLHGLTVWIHYPKLVYMTVVWGLGPFGAIAAVYLLLRRKMTRVEWALVTGNAAAILIPMRYTVNRGFSPHYFIFTALLGAWLAAFMMNRLLVTIKNPEAIRYISATAVVLIVAVYAVHFYKRRNPLPFQYSLQVTTIGKKLSEIAKPGSLVIARSIADERERGSWGHGINNYEDPRMFYLANVHGWSLPRDAKGAALIDKYVKQGAEYYAEPYHRRKDAELYDYLDKHGYLVCDSDLGRIYKFKSESK